MIIFDFLYVQMVQKELIQSYKHGGSKIVAPSTGLGKPKSKIEILELFDQNDLYPIDFLVDIYTQVKNIIFKWELSENDLATINQFKEDEWLKEHYFNQDYSWDVVKEFLSGYLYVPPFEKLFGRYNNKEDGYYVVSKHMGLDSDSFCPLDYSNRFTALLKIEGKQIIDNVWLLDLDAQELYDMNITIDEYLNLAYKAKIFNGWQHVYLFKENSEYYELMKRFLPKIVPHIKLDLTDFNI